MNGRVEKIVAQSVIDGTTVDFTLQGGRELLNGVESKWGYLGFLVLDNAELSLGPVIEKAMGLQEVLTDPASPNAVVEAATDAYVSVWRDCKAAGMNVVPWMWRTTRGSILQPDITEGGRSAIYGKSTVLMLRGQHDLDKRHPHQLDTIFLRITDQSSFASVVALAKRQMDLATRAGIMLPVDDAFDLVLHPDGNGTACEVVTFDFSLAHTDTGENLRELNVLWATQALLWLVKNRTALLEQHGRPLDVGYVHSRQSILAALSQPTA